VEPRLNGIEMPCLVIQSSGDPVVDPRGSEKIFRMLGTRDKQFVLFSLERHGILLGERSEKVYRTIADFLRQLR
jgi:esterase/lipase